MFFPTAKIPKEGRIRAPAPGIFASVAHLAPRRRRGSCLIRPASAEEAAIRKGPVQKNAATRDNAAQKGEVTRRPLPHSNFYSDAYRFLFVSTIIAPLRALRPYSRMAEASLRIIIERMFEGSPSNSSSSPDFSLSARYSLPSMTQSTPFCEVSFVEPPFTEIIGSPYGRPCPAAAAAADEPEEEVEVEVEVETEPAPEAEAETEVPSPVMTMVCGEEAS